MNKFDRSVNLDQIGKTVRGFTLIEILVTVVITSLLGVVIVQAFITTIGANAKTEIIKDIKQNGDFAVDIISRKIRNARSMDCSSNANQIFLTNQDTSTTRFRSVTDTTTGTCRIAQTDTVAGVSSTTYITGGNMTLVGATCANAALSVACQQIAAQDAKALITFSLENLTSQTKTYEQATQKFTTTVSLRNVQY